MVGVFWSIVVSAEFQAAGLLKSPVPHELLVRDHGKLFLPGFFDDLCGHGLPRAVEKEDALVHRA